MFFTGLLYLLFEGDILKRSKTQLSDAVSNSGSRVIMGMQVGMVLLATIVTRSSAASLQAKQGLPLGNQVVGWGVLGRYRPSDFLRLKLIAV